MRRWDAAVDMAALDDAGDIVFLPLCRVGLYAANKTRAERVAARLANTRGKVFTVFVREVRP